MSVKRCQQEIDSREFSEWIARINQSKPAGNETQPGEPGKITDATAIEAALSALYGNDNQPFS